VIILAALKGLKLQPPWDINSMLLPASAVSIPHTGPLPSQSHHSESSTASPLMFEIDYIGCRSAENRIQSVCLDLQVSASSGTNVSH